MRTFSIINMSMIFLAIILKANQQVLYFVLFNLSRIEYQKAVGNVSSLVVHNPLTQF